MGEVERSPAGAERGDRDGDFEKRLGAVLGRDLERPEIQTPDFGRERIAPDELYRDRRDAILGRQRDTENEHGKVESERAFATRDGVGRDQTRRDAILGRGRSAGQDREQGRDRDRDRER